MSRSRDIADLGGGITQADLPAEGVNESKLQVSNAPTNGYMLTAQSGNTGGMTWAEAPSSSTAFGAVGTYVFAQHRGSPAFTQGQVIAAGTYALRPTNAFGNTGGTNISSGSWRCMGVKADSFTNEEASTLFVRIA